MTSLDTYAPLIEPDRASDEDRARQLGEFASRHPVGVVERLSRKPFVCAICRSEWPAGTVHWTSSRPFQGGRKWWTDRVCPFCPEPFPPVVRVPVSRIEAWIKRNVIVRRAGPGRPTVTLSREEVALVVSLRASGLSERKLSAAFAVSTGRRISARKLAQFGRV